MDRTKKIFLRKIFSEIGFILICFAFAAGVMVALDGVWNLLIHIFPERSVAIVLSVGVLLLFIGAFIASLIGWLKEKWKDSEWESKHGG